MRFDHVETTRVDGILVLRWTCPRCGDDVEESLDGIPWECELCGEVDRDVETLVDRLVRSEGSR